MSKGTTASLALITSLVAFLVVPRAMAEPIEDQTTVRELCRKAVAGAYLKAQNDRDWDERYLLSVSTQLTQLEKAIGGAKKDLSANAAKLAKADFDVPLSEERMRLETLVRSLEQRSIEFKKLKSDAEVRATQSRKHLKDIDNQVQGTFQVIRVDDGTEKGYPFRLNYRSSCPKYRYLCPLPPKEATNLLKITVENNKVPEPCRRYSQISAH